MGGPGPSPHSSCPSEAVRHREQCGDAGGTQWAVWIGQYYSSGTGLPVCHGFADLLWQEVTWTKSKWDNDDSIFFCLYSVFLFSYQCLNEQKKNNKKSGKAHQFLVPWHSCFSKFFGFLCFHGLLVWCYFTVLKKGTKYQFKGKKTAIMPTNILFYCISVVFTCFCLKTNTWIYMYVCICII